MRGRVVSVVPHPSVAGHVVLGLELAEARDVPTFANFFTAVPAGTRVDVIVPAADVSRAGVTTGDVISARIHRTDPFSVYAERGSLARVGE